MRRRFRRFQIKPEEMNITAFMNLMVILVPFLLITAVFSRLTILELNLPPASASQKKPDRSLQLEITIRDDALEVGDRNSGPIQRIGRKGGNYDFKALSGLLQKLKERYPDKTNATILSESSTSYDTLVQVMDAVRVVQGKKDGIIMTYELFPDIAIGDAPTGRGGRK